MNPNSIQSAIRFVFGAVSLSILAACGGEAGGGLDVADGGIRGTGSSVGPVSGFGSVFVNGIRFDTDGLNRFVESDDGISHESELDKGMILRVDGVWRNDGQGTANRVEYDDTLRGEIVVNQAWNPLGTKTATVTIYGLVVHIDSQTVVKGKKVTELTDGDFVRVSAWRLPNDEFRASFLRVRSGSSAGTFDQVNEIELEGQVSDFSESMRTFTLGNVTVEFDPQITEFGGIGISDLADNPYVEVEGNFNGSSLFAREIEEDDRRRYRRGDEDDIEFAGPVSSAFNAENSVFLINGLLVLVTGDTDFEDGLTREDLVPGLLIQIEGEFLDDVTVEAEKITLREGESEVKGGVDRGSVDRGTQTFTVGGVGVQVTSQTVIVNEDEVRLDFNDLEDLKKVEVNGIERVSAEGEVLLEAFKVEIDDDFADQKEFELVGRLQEMDFFSINVLGASIAVKSDTKFGDTSRDKLQSMSDEEGARPLVAVKYRQTALEFIADDIELKGD